MDQTRLSRVIPFLVLLIAVYSVQRFSSMPLGNTFIWWGIHAFTLFAFYWESRYSMQQEEEKAVRVVKWYLLWNVFSIIRGAFFMAENYWDYKGLVSMGMTLLLPVVAYIALNSHSVQHILAYYIRYALPAAIFVFLFLGLPSWGWYLFPISLLMLFFPALNLRGKAIVLIISIAVIMGGLVVRSYLIKYGVPMLLILFYYYRGFPLAAKIMQFIRLSLLIIPWFFLFLAISGVFNVFNMKDYINGDLASVETTTGDGGKIKSNLADDSRTFLYEEVIQSSLKYNYWILGRSPARGNETFFFADEMSEITGRSERLINEVGILNVFTWTGLIGVLLIFIVFVRASYFAINRSNNIYVKILGLFVALRWTYFWVEDYQAFNINAFVIWMMIGMCFSGSFRKMNNAEVKFWVNGIFSRKIYALYQDYSHNLSNK